MKRIVSIALVVTLSLAAICAFAPRAWAGGQVLALPAQRLSAEDVSMVLNNAAGAAEYRLGILALVGERVWTIGSVEWMTNSAIVTERVRGPTRIAGDSSVVEGGLTEEFAEGMNGMRDQRIGSCWQTRRIVRIRGHSCFDTA